jgi:hypothetical protein
MRSEADIMKRLNDEIASYLTCPKFTVEEHAHNVTMLAWVLDISDVQLSEMIKEAEASFGVESEGSYDEKDKKDSF